MRSAAAACRHTRVAVLLLACFCALATGLHAQIFGGGGFTWRPVGPNVIPARVAGIAVDPRADYTVYLAAPGGGVWKSVDVGQTWSPQMDSAVSLPVCSVAVDPIILDLVYAGTGDELSPRPAQGLMRSADGGRTWTSGVRFTNRPVCLLAIDPLNSTRLLAGSAEGLFVSHDSGASWKKVLSRQVSDVAFDGQGNIYAGVLTPDTQGTRQNLLARSADGGLTWTYLPLPVPEGGAGQTTWMAVLTRTGSLSVALAYESPTSSSLLIDFGRSTDGGAAWPTFTAIATMPASTATLPQRISLVADPDPNILYLAARTLLRSVNQGASWNSLSTVTQRFNAARIGGGSLLLAGERGVEAVAIAEGARSGVTTNLPIGQFLGVAFDTLNNPWAGGLSGLFGVIPKISDWFDAVTSTSFGPVVASGSGAQNIFASTNATLYRSTDGGASFASSTVIPVGQLRAPYPPLLLDPVTPTTVFTAGRRVYRSTDSGATWTALGTVDPDLNTVIVALTMAPLARQIMYAATACLPEVTPKVTCPPTSAVWRSTNSGSSWARVSALPGLVSRLASDRAQPNLLYAAIGSYPGGPSGSAGYYQGDLLRTAEATGAPGGREPVWLSVRGNLPRVAINTVLVDPAGAGSAFLPAQVLYVGTDAGVYVTQNAGVRWTAINSGLPRTPITDLSLRQPGATLRAATFGRGIYQVSMSGFAESLVVDPLSVQITLLQGTSVTAGASLIAAASAVPVDWRAASLEPWITVPQETGHIEARGAGQVAFRVSAATLPGGTYFGRVRVSSGTSSNTLVQDILVVLKVIAAPAQLVALAGNGGSGVAGSMLPPFTVQARDADGMPVGGVPITFAIISGGGALNARTAVTDAAGQASTTLTLPIFPGPVQVTASAGTVSVAFTATAVDSGRPTLRAGSAVNGASFNSAAPLAPGSIVSIFGSNLSDSDGSADSLPLPTSLQNTRVLVQAPGGELALPLFYVSAGQINALLPSDLPPGAYQLIVESGSGRGNPIDVVVAAAAPGIFTLASSGRGPGIFTRENGALVTPTNPIRRGNVVVLYATGLGAVDPPVADGAPGATSEPLNRTVLTPVVRFDMYEAEVLFSGLAPGFTGLYQVNVRVPSLVSPASNVPVSLTIGGALSNTVTIPIQ